jgi:predicted nucleic acid-binding protein
MNGNSLLLDTNTVLYLLAGDETLAEFLNGKKLYISIISELELLSYKQLTTKDIKILNAFISELQIVNINQDVKNTTIEIRKSTSLKLPDCIIAATSMILNIPLISADKALKNVKNLDLILYEK